MAIKLYTDNCPPEIMEKLKNENIITNKDEVVVVYVNTFLKNIRDANIITREKIINWVAKKNTAPKRIINFKKIKDITYTEKGLYGTISYQLSARKTFELRLNRKDGEEFYKHSLKAWEDCQPQMNTDKTFKST